MANVIKGQAIVPGIASGKAIVSQQPLSFWGGYDQVTGEIIDRRNDLSGSIASGKILAFPFTVGSSTTTAIANGARTCDSPGNRTPTPASSSFTTRFGRLVVPVHVIPTGSSSSSTAG